MLNKKLKDFFHENGFVHLKNFLNQHLLVELRNEVERYINDKVPFLDPGDVFFDNPEKPETLKQLHRMEQDPFFNEYRNHPLWIETSEFLLNEPVEPAMGVELFNKPPNTNHETPPHQDNYYFCLEPPKVLTIWVALDLADQTNGCMKYVAGSHLNGIRNHDTSNTLGFSQSITDFCHEDAKNEKSITAKPGDALIHHGNTIHRAGVNQTQNRHRRGFAMVFKAVSAKRNENKFKIYDKQSKIQQNTFGIQING